MKKVLCIGHAAYDITMLVDNYPKENTKNRCEGMVECGGGPASNAAYLLGKWGIDTSFAGVVGNDSYGEKIKKEFDSIGVKTTYLELSKKYKTTISLIVVNKNTGSRTSFAYRDQDAKMKSKTFKIKPNYILVDGEDAEVAIDIIKKNKKAISVIDAGRNKPNVVRLAKLVDYIVCSKVFAEEYTGLKVDFNNHKSIKEVFNVLEKSFKGKIVITIEEKGCLYSINGVVKLMPGYKVKEIRDTTGAGDIFHGAFMYGLINDYSYEDILRIANITGALSVRKVGSRYSMPDLKEVLSIYENSR